MAGTDEFPETLSASSTGSCPDPRVFPFGDRTFDGTLPEKEQQALLWTMENRRHSGAFTGRFPSCAFQYLSVYAGDIRFGVVGIDMGGRPFTEFENTILLSLLHECTMALENRRIEQERKTAEILAENERLRAALLRSISHDLRTPLTSILGNASNLRSHEHDLLPQVRAEIYEDIMEDAGWLNAQFENILSLTKMESRQGLQKTLENMEDVVEESLRHTACHHGHVITFVRSDQILFAEIDAKLIVQVLINLLNNAIRYTPPGSRICVRLQRRDEMIRVEVSDDGPGIPDEDKPRVFDLFYTGKTAPSDSGRSMGIGLNLCSLIIRAHGGSIDVADNVPKGSVFGFSIPAKRVTFEDS